MRLIVFATAAAFSAAACGAEFPNKPLRLIVPSAPGGGIDFTARVIATQLTNVLRQSVVVDNRAGASGIMGAETVARAAPDGHTLLMASSSLSVAPHIYKNVPYDIVKDFAPVSLVARSPNLLVVHPAVPAKSVKELIALGKAQPGKLNFSSSGNGRASHLAAATLKALQGKETRDKFLSDGSEPVGSTPEEFRRFLIAEVDRWGKVVKAAGIKPE